MSQPRFSKSAVRRLQSPAERFGPPSSVTPAAPDAQAPDAQAPDAQAPDAQAPDAQAPDAQAPDAQVPDAQAPDDASRTATGAHAIAIEPAEVAPTATAPAPTDPFQPLPDSPSSAATTRGNRSTNRARRAPRTHAPRHHEKRPHQVAHSPVKPAPAERSAEGNVMTRALVARRRARWKRFMARVLAVALVLFVAQCAVAALTAPQFQIKRVEISGLTSKSAAVEKLAAPLVGQNIFRAPGAALAGKVEALPTVASARVVRPLHWPPQLRLEVTERQPFVRVGAGDNWWVADAAGVPFRRARPDDKGDEMLYALTAPQFSPQTGHALPSAQWAHARELVRALQTDNALAASASASASANVADAGAAQNSVAVSDAPRFWQLRRLYLDRDGFAAVRVSGQNALASQRELLIRLGEEDWAAKLAQARVAVAYLNRTGQRAGELDLVSGEHPRWRPLEPIAQTQKTVDGTNGVS